MSNNSKWSLLEAHEPLKQSNADLCSTKDSLALIHDMVVTVIIVFIIIIIVIEKDHLGDWSPEKDCC